MQAIHVLLCFVVGYIGQFTPLRWRHNERDTAASQITSLTIIYSTAYSDADQRKHQSSASLGFVRGIHQGIHRGIPRTDGQ